MIRHSISLWPLCSELARHLGMLRTVSFIHLHLFNLDLSFSASLPFSSLKRPQKKKIHRLWSIPFSLCFYCVDKVLVKTLLMPLHILNYIIDTILTLSIIFSLLGLFQAESEWRGWICVCRGSCSITAHIMYWKAIESASQCLHLSCFTPALAFSLCKVCVHAKSELSLH